MPLTLCFAEATYFFKGKEYWKVLDSDLEAEPGYPQSIARDWLVCSDMQADSPEPAESTRTGGRSKQRHHDESRSESEVCSCTSSSPGPLWLNTALRLYVSLMFASLWTAASVSGPLWQMDQKMLPEDSGCKKVGSVKNPQATLLLKWTTYNIPRNVAETVSDSPWEVNCTYGFSFFPLFLLLASFNSRFQIPCLPPTPSFAFKLLKE